MYDENPFRAQLQRADPSPGAHDARVQPLAPVEIDQLPQPLRDRVWATVMVLRGGRGWS